VLAEGISITGTPISTDELQSIVRQGKRILPRCGGTKPALANPPEGVASLDMSQWAGMIEYEPSEYTFTALAGTRLKAVVELLAKNGQYMPFDPPLVKLGATLGGTVGAGLSGSGRYHYGGVRDFLMGVRFIDGGGQLVSSGGRVVKNSAGFDLPKLMVGSRGSLGVMVEMTFKVFPKPEVYNTLLVEVEELELAYNMMQKAANARLDIDCLDLEVSKSGYRLWIRVGGLAEALLRRMERFHELLGDFRLYQGAEEEMVWAKVSEMNWIPEGWSLIKAPTILPNILSLEANLAGKNIYRRYVAGGQFALIALPEALQSLEQTLFSLGLSGLVLRGGNGLTRLGASTGASFLKRVKSVLDPSGRFVEA
jgi:glycolate oxidase FAD binding subunit